MRIASFIVLGQIPSFFLRTYRIDGRTERLLADLQNRGVFGEHVEHAHLIQGRADVYQSGKFKKLQFREENIQILETFLKTRFAIHILFFFFKKLTSICWIRWARI